MRKKFFIFNILILSAIISQNIRTPSLAQERVQAFQSDKAVSTPVAAKEENSVYTYYIKNESSEDANELNNFLANYLIALNSHDLKKIDDYYASNYINGDGLNKNQMIDLLKQTWEKCPDLKYSTAIKNLRLANNRASVEFNEDITATTKNISEITKDKGSVNGTSHNILYFEKYGCGWKIVTDKTLYEETTIKYGAAKNININFDTPEQVISGENYTASLKVDLPAESFALASLTSAPLVYPVKQPEETFRQVPSDLKILERLIKSNKDCLNEISSASVSFCEAQRSTYTNFDIKVTGITVILKRVNVLPKQ